MRKQKIVWQSINFPKTLFKKIQALIVRTGDVSVAEYARVAAEMRMRKDLERLESNEEL